MKKLFTLLIFSLFSLTVLAEEVVVDGIKYNIVAQVKQAEVIRNDPKYRGHIIIPASITVDGVEYSVTSIGSYAFSSCVDLYSITIPNSVTSIGSSAFNFCSGLTAVNIEDLAAWCNIEFDSYTANPCYYAHKLLLNGEEIKDLVIPNSVTSISNFAFYGCSGLTSVTIPNSVTSIGNYAFYGCSGLTSVTIPNSVTKIYGYAFSGCSGLTSVTIPNSVTSIGNYTFENCI